MSFIPGDERIWFTSNRDEKKMRPPAVPVAVNNINGANVLFPRDSKALGTWIALQENGNAAVLLNGAFSPHSVQPTYRISRGQVLLQLISREEPSRQIHQFNLSGVEPFTLILWEQESLLEYRWDGVRLHEKLKDGQQPYIWSSVTLYSSDIIRKRENWFQDFLERETSINAESLLNFHRFAGDGDPQQSLIMERGEVYATVSITNLECNADRAVMRYLDIVSQTKTEAAMSIFPVVK